MDGWTHSSTGTRVSPTDPCPQTHPRPRCRVPTSFREGDNAKPPAPAQPKGHKAGHREHSLAAGCPLHGHREPCPPAQDTPADPITGAWSPHTGAGGVIEAAAVPHTPQQLKIARRKEINSRRSPARSHQPNQHRLFSVLAFHRGFYPRLLGFHFLPPSRLAGRGREFISPPMSPSCHLLQAGGVDVTPRIPPLPVCAAAPWPAVPGPLFHASSSSWDRSRCPAGWLCPSPPLLPGQRWSWPSSWHSPRC